MSRDEYAFDDELVDEWDEDPWPDDIDDDTDDRDRGCVFGEHCCCPHIDHESWECFTAEGAAEYERALLAEERKRVIAEAFARWRRGVADVVMVLGAGAGLALAAPAVVAFTLTGALSDWIGGDDDA